MHLAAPHTSDVPSLWACVKIPVLLVRGGLSNRITEFVRVVKAFLG